MNKRVKRNWSLKRKLTRYMSCEGKENGNSEKKIVKEEKGIEIEEDTAEITRTREIVIATRSGTIEIAKEKKDEKGNVLVAVAEKRKVTRRNFASQKTSQPLSRPTHKPNKLLVQCRAISRNSITFEGPTNNSTRLFKPSRNPSLCCLTRMNRRTTQLRKKKRYLPAQSSN